MSEAPKKRWYVVQAFSGFEGRVATSLREHIKLHNMEDLFGEVMVPTEEVVEIRGGQRRKSERKFFPGYVLVQMVMNDASWHLVRSVPRVMGFIGGTSDRPAPISFRYIRTGSSMLTPSGTERSMFSISISSSSERSMSSSSRRRRSRSAAFGSSVMSERRSTSIPLASRYSNTLSICV